MRVLIITQNYLPEMGALSNRIYPIARQLAQDGHETFIATGMPNYPGGVVFPAYRRRLFMRERMEGVTVLRTAYYTAPRNISKARQLASYLSFVMAALHSGLRAGKLDVVFVTSPPIFPTLAGMWISRLRGARLVMDLRDLWPDEIVACGAASEGSLPVRFVRSIERAGYRRADTVSCTTHAFMETVAERGVDTERTLFAPNGADIELFRPQPPDNPVSRRYEFGDRFVVMYSGLLGIKHDLDTILDAAALLRDNQEIAFFLRGSGPCRQPLIDRAKREGLTNVLFGDELPIGELPHIIARANCCVTSLLPDPYLDKIISVKIFEYLACEKPVVAALAGEGARVIRESGGGLVVPAGDARAMADAVLELYRQPDVRARMGQSGREFVLANYSRGATAERISASLARLCGAASGSPEPAAD